MTMSIKSNLSAVDAQRTLGKNEESIRLGLRNIASGLRINQAADDAAGLSISERLRSIERGFQQSSANIQDATSALQVAEGGMEQTGETLQRIRELAVQASNDTLTDDDRAVIQGEVDQLVSEIDRMTGNTTFNGRQLLSGDYSSANGGLNVQMGASEGDSMSVALNEVSASSLGVSRVDVSTRGAASASLSQLDTAVSTLSSQRSEIGANINRMESASTFVGTARENTLSALSQLRDADMGQETTKLAISKVLQQANASALTQANLNPQNALKLLGA
jgi:flagellin